MTFALLNVSFEKASIVISKALGKVQRLSPLFFDCPVPNGAFHVARQKNEVNWKKQKILPRELKLASGLMYPHMSSLSQSP